MRWIYLVLALFVVGMTVLIVTTLAHQSAHRQDCADLGGVYVHIRQDPDLCLAPDAVLGRY